MRALLLAALAGAAAMNVAPAFAVPAPPPPPAPPSQAPSSSYAANARVFLVGAKQTEVQLSQAQQFMADQSRGLFFIPKNVTTHMVFFLTDAPALVAAPSPVFEISIVGVPWADSAHIIPVIVRLQRKNGHDHVVGSQATSVNVFTSVNTIEPFADDRVPTKVDVVAAGRFRITPVQSLEPGEYGIALRDPDAKSWSHKMNDPSTAGLSEQQMYQSYVWAFSVNGGQQQ